MITIEVTGDPELSKKLTDDINKMKQELLEKIDQYEFPKEESNEEFDIDDELEALLKELEEE